MSSVDYLPIPPPHPKADASPPKTTTEQEEMYKKVYEHFTKDGYVLPDEEKGEFTEEEKFWLVCNAYSHFSALGSVDDHRDARATNVC